MTEPQSSQAQHVASESVSFVLERVSGFRWFERVGQCPDSSDPVTLRISCNGTPDAVMPIYYVENHVEAAACLKSQYDGDWLESEEQRRLQLRAAVDNSSAGVEFWNSFRRLVDQLPGQIMQRAEKNLATADVYLPRVGAGSAVEACYLYALEVFVTGRPSAIALDRLNLFELGRWPLCLSHHRFVVF